MRVQTEEWRQFIPGIRMYRGKMTLFYNGEKLRENGRNEFFVYDRKERKKWEVIIVLPGVELIQAYTFADCWNVKTVIMADTVTRIERTAFYNCHSLDFVRLSRSLEYIGVSAFRKCESLPSIFIPLSCTNICNWSFDECIKLMILVVPSTDTELRDQVISNTALIEASQFETDRHGEYDYVNNEVNQWIKNINRDTDEYALHRACSSYNPINCRMRSQ